MALEVNNTDWGETHSVDVPGQSANPVFKFSSLGNNGIVWVKIAAGGAAIQFADRVIGRTGLVHTGSRWIRDDAERLRVVAKIDERGSPAAKHKIEEVRTRLGQGEDMIVMRHVQGRDFGNGVNRVVQDQDPQRLSFFAVIETPTIQEDIAKLIAVDMLLGNFDRIAFADDPYGGYGRFHEGNLKIGPAGQHLIAIDNDTVSPSIEHLRGERNTTEDLYRLAMQGGLLDTEAPFAQNDQASMHKLLSEGTGSHAVYTALKAFAEPPRSRRQLNPEQDRQLHSAADAIAPLVRAQMQALVQNNLKGANGILNDLKQLSDLPGLNYDVFKVRARFALLVGVAGDNVNVSMERALGYGKYRDWKSKLRDALAAVQKYELPADLDLSFARGEKTIRNLSAAVSVFSRGPTIQYNAHAIKDEIRDRETRPTYERLQECMRLLQGQTDRAAKKSMVLVVAELHLQNALQRIEAVKGILDVVQHHQHDWVGSFYLKAVCKRVGRFRAMSDDHAVYGSEVLKALEVIEGEKGKKRSGRKTPATDYEHFHEKITAASSGLLFAVTALEGYVHKVRLPVVN